MTLREARRALLPLSLVSSYPLLSTVAMVTVWQIRKFYCRPFLGAYYLRWVDLYAVDHPGYWGPELVRTSRLYYGIYFSGILALLILTGFALFSTRRKQIPAWGLFLLWSADAVFLAVIALRNGITWQAGVNFGEHLLFLCVQVFLLIRGRPVWKTLPKKVRKQRRTYDPRF